MNKNELVGFLLNPFTRINSWKAFALSILFTIAIAITGTYANVYFDGAIDVHFSSNATFKTSINCLIIGLLSLVTTLSIAGYYLTRTIRLLDLLAAVALAKAPFLILALIALAAKAPSTELLLENPSAAFGSISFLIVMILSIPVLVWYLILLYNAFKSTTNARGVKVVPTFIAAILVAEIISKIIIALIS